MIDPVHQEQETYPFKNEPISSAERRALEERRRYAGIDPSAHTVGVALSGGGIRSATFCLGLLRGLAVNKLLPRFDYLSTVSGGGYIGATFGRLIERLGIHDAQDHLARGDSTMLHWLRRYARYLTPRGARDYGVAIATYMRSAVAIHLEIGMLALLLGVVIVLPHAWQWQWNLLEPLAWRPWKTVWWPLALAIWLTMAPGAMSSFWSLRDEVQTSGRLSPSTARSRIALIDLSVILLLLCALLWLVFEYRWICGSVDGKIDACDLGKYFHVPLRAAEMRWVVVLVLASVVIRGLSTFLRFAARSKRPLRIVNAEQRQRLTLSLRVTNIIALTLLLAGLLDLATWHLKEGFMRGPAWLFGSVGLGTLMVAFGRSMLEPLQKLTERAEGPRLLSFRTFMNLIGLLVGAALLIGWVTFVQWFVFGDTSQGVPPWMDQYFPWFRATVLAAFPLAWIALTSFSRETTNATSLHSFYRGRIVRAYLRIGNPAFGLDKASGEAPSVTTVEENDDTRLERYAPDAKGGPIHLISTCINKTRARKSGMYNADRKGMRLTASRHGLEVGAQDFPAHPGAKLGTLGQWIAMSGAAASPGAGSYTSPGWALLLFMSGIRLGYWFPSARAQERQGLLGRLLAWSRDAKYGRLASEAVARFHGADERAWYLSDGGHFENTGVHALLQRETDFILLADCGADPKFELGDLENLVRKARIDYNAEIEFYAEEANGLFGIGAEETLCVLAPETLGSNFSARGILLARITYRRGKTKPCDWKLGTLVVVKPNLHKVLDPDILAYARRNPQFPQQSTSDQFFDEAQWESYHRLGEDFGRAITPEWLSHIPGWSNPMPRVEESEPVRRPNNKERKEDESKPFWRTETKAAALGATLGVGALGALVVPLWQGFDEFRTRRQTEATQYNAFVSSTSSTLQPWVQKGQSPEGKDTDFDGDYGSVQQLYERVKDRNREDRDRGVRLVAVLQGACFHDQTSAVVQRTCPAQRAEHDLCTAVCDQRQGGDPYWPTALEKAASSDGAPEPVSQRALTEAITAQQKSVASAAPSLAQAPATTDNASVAPSASPLEACRSIELYVQVYDEAMRKEVVELQWGDIPDVHFYGVENVVATSLARGSGSPYRWKQPTLILHRLDEDAACGAALKAWLEPKLAMVYPPKTQVTIRKLPDVYKGTARTIEMWFPTPH